MLSTSPSRNIFSHLSPSLKSFQDWPSTQSPWAITSVLYRSANSSKTSMQASRSWTWRMIRWGVEVTASSTMSRRSRTLCMIFLCGILSQKQNQQHHDGWTYRTIALELLKWWYCSHWTACKHFLLSAFIRQGLRVSELEGLRSVK